MVKYYIIQIVYHTKDGDSTPRYIAKLNKGGYPEIECSKDEGKAMKFIDYTMAFLVAKAKEHENPTAEATIIEKEGALCF